MMTANHELNRILPWVEMGKQRVAEIGRMVDGAIEGDPAAELALGELSDREFARYLQVRRQLRLTDTTHIANAPKQATPPTFPAGVGSGSPSGYNADPAADGRQLRGISRIEAALAAAAAG